MKNYIFLILAVLLFSRCRECTNEVNEGEKVIIPIIFEDFSLFEINEFDVIRIERTTLKRDTFKLPQILTGFAARSTTVSITDRAYKSNPGYYGSYFDNSDLILKWRYGSDTLSDIKIKKSEGPSPDKCSDDDPNVKIDQLSFVYKGKTIQRNESIKVSKN